MTNKDLGKNQTKVLRYYQDRITKVINELENSDKKYSNKDFPMKINMSIIGEEDILSNVIIDKNYSLLRKESEVYIYPSDMKSLLTETIEQKENILKKKNVFNDDTSLFAFCSLYCFIFLFIDIISSLTDLKNESIVEKVIDIGVFNSFCLFLCSLLVIALLDEKYDLNLNLKPIPFALFLLLSFLLAPINALIYMIIFAKETIKEIRKANNYSETDLGNMEELKELIKDLPQSVKDIVLAEKVSFY